jgi:hypothetical protein
VASAVFFMVMLKSQLELRAGHSFGLLVLGLLWSLVVYFFFIAIFTAAPAALFIWLVNKLRIQYLAVFVAFGALLGWLALLVFYQVGQPEILLLFGLAGSAAGLAYWFVTEKRNP